MEKSSRAAMFTKVPAITGFFWIIKLLTTAMGEALSDFSVRVNERDAVIIAAFVLAGSLVLQFRAKRYVAWVYWLVVAMISVFGTMAADIVHHAGVSLAVSTSAFAAILAVLFFAWHKAEGTLSIHSIFTVRREAFYWAAVFASFALGTAAGDLTANTFHMGNLISGYFFTVLFVLPAIGYRFFRLNDIMAFWISYIMTRPLGASFADWVSKPGSHGGLNAGTGAVSAVLVVLIVMLVAYLSVSHKDIDQKPR
jgi:uncharacterized membrane-anchored protein